MENLTYQEFGEAFILSAVTPDRVVSAISKIAGDSLELGPLRAGPAGAASVKAKGTIGEPVAEEVAGEQILAYSVCLPIDLTLEVRVGAVGHFRARGEIELRLSVRTAMPLAILIDVAEVTPADARFNVTAHGVQSKLLRRAGDVEGELRAHAAAYVNQQTSSAQARRFMRIELGPLIESAWSSL